MQIRAFFGQIRRSAKNFCSNLKPQPHPETEEQKFKSKLVSVTAIVNVAQTAKKATCLMTITQYNSTSSRGIEWSLIFEQLRACEQCVLLLRALAVINFLMRAASTLEIANGEQRGLCKFSTSWNLSLSRRCFAPSNMADTFKTGQQAQSYNRWCFWGKQTRPEAF